MSMVKSPHDRRRFSFLAAGAGLVTLLATTFVGCGDEPVLVARGAWFLNLVDSGTNCQHADHPDMIGQVTADARTTLVGDGDPIDANDPALGNYSVSCSLIANASGGVDFEAAQSGADGGVTFIVPTLTADATKDKPAVGTVSWTSTYTAKTFSSQKCNFYFAAGTGQSLKTDEVWLTFDCPEIAGAIDDVCTISVGYLAYSSCHTEATSQ